MYSKLKIEKIIRNIYIIKKKINLNNLHLNIDVSINYVNIIMKSIVIFDNFTYIIHEFDLFNQSKHSQIINLLYMKNLRIYKKTLDGIALDLNLSLSTLQRYRIKYCDYFYTKLDKNSIDMEMLQKMTDFIIKKVLV